MTEVGVPSATDYPLAADNLLTPTLVNNLGITSDSMQSNAPPTNVNFSTFMYIYIYCVCNKNCFHYHCICLRLCQKPSPYYGTIGVTWNIILLYSFVLDCVRSFPPTIVPLV